jgi:hypothetical protein
MDLGPETFLRRPPVLSSPMVSPLRSTVRTDGPRRWFPASGQILLAVSALVAVVVMVLSVPGSPGPTPAAPTVGETELIRVTAPDGTTVQAVARIDTGASSSAIDRGLAEDLGLDLENAPTVRVRSSLGVEVRPVVGVAIQLAGDATPARVSVSDRAGLPEQVLLGREQLGGFQVAVGQSLLTSPGGPVAPSAVDALFLQTAALAPGTLLALLPLCALFIVVLRLWVGVSTLGTFAPVLLGIGYVQSGLFVGIVLTLALFGVGLVLQVLLRRSRLPRVARLGILIAVVATVLAALQSTSASVGTLASWGVAVPVVVTATVIERLWEAWDDEGLRAAAGLAGVTLAVSVLVAALLLAPSLRYLAETVPVHFAVACVLWTWAAGSYKGLRLTELVRFAPASRGLPERLAA